MKLRLGVNIDHVATLRQARGGPGPDPVHAAGVCLLGGADGITVHLREDRRHIQDRDLELLRRTVPTHLNMEMAATDEMTSIACSVKPDAVCIVPEKRRELTTEGGLDVVGAAERLGTIIPRLAEAGIEVSLFIDPDEPQIRAAAEVGASHVELHTGAYANAPRGEARDAELEKLIRAARIGHEVGLHVNAGHGIDYDNIDGILEVPFLEELNIGYSIICRAVFTGLEQAVRDMVTAMSAYVGGREG